MTRFVAVSVERHANKCWRRFSSYDFARAQSVVELVAAELPKAAVAMPIALMRGGDASYRLVALLGLEPGNNLYVAPDGRWLGRYIPAVLRGHPFRLLNTGDDRYVLCLDEDSDLFGDEGEPFFVAGQVAPALSEVVSFLQQIEVNRQRTVQACALLDQHALITPWAVTVQGTAGEHRIEDLYRVDETAMGQLSGTALVALRDAGALALAYCQLLSMQQLPLLGELSAASVRVPQTPSAREEGFILGDDGGTLQFNWEASDERS